MNKQPEVLWRSDHDYSVRDYPKAAKHLSEEEFQKVWTGRAIVIQAIPSVTTGESGLAINQYAQDFGLIDEGQVYECKYVISNTSSHAVDIKGFSTSCGCAIAKGQMGQLSPGTQSSITLKFDSHGKTGYQQYYCVVNTDHGNMLLKLSGYVRSEGGYYPKTLDLGAVARDEGKKTLGISFLGQSVDTVRPIISVTVPSTLSYSIDKDTNDEWKVAEDRLLVQLDPSVLPMGPFSELVRVTYHRDDKRETVTIPITGTIVDAKRQGLLFVAKSAKIGEEIHQTFLLRGVKKTLVARVIDNSGSGLTFDIVQDDATDASLRVSGKPAWSGSKEVSVTFVDAFGPNKVIYDVYITIDMKGQ